MHPAQPLNPLFHQYYLIPCISHKRGIFLALATSDGYRRRGVMHSEPDETWRNAFLVSLLISANHSSDALISKQFTQQNMWFSTIDNMHIGDSKQGIQASRN